MKRITVNCCGLLLALSLAGCMRLQTRRWQTEPTSQDSSGEPVRVSAEKTEAAEPAVATGPDGTVYVVWVEHRGEEADVWLARFDGESKQLGPPARVNPNEGEATAWRGDPPTVAVAPDGAAYVGWTALDRSAPHASTLYLSASRDGGRSFEAPSKVNDDAKPGAHGLHSLAVASDGSVYLAWLDERDIERKEADPSQAPAPAHTESNRVVYFASSEDGGRTFSRNLKVAAEVCPCCKTSLAVGGGGRVYVGWRQVLPGDFRHIAVAASDDGGQSFRPPVVVSDDRWELRGCPVSGPALKAAGADTLHVLWYTAGEAGRPGLYWSESHDGGTTFKPRRLLAETNGHGTPSLVQGEGGELSAVWEGAEGVNLAPMRVRRDGDAYVKAPAVLTAGGELPAAVASAGRVLIACGMKDREGRGVWVVSAEGEGSTVSNDATPPPATGNTGAEQTHEH